MFLSRLHPRHAVHYNTFPNFYLNAKLLVGVRNGEGNIQNMATNLMLKAALLKLIQNSSFREKWSFNLRKRAHMKFLFLDWLFIVRLEIKSFLHFFWSVFKNPNIIVEMWVLKSCAVLNWRIFLSFMLQWKFSTLYFTEKIRANKEIFWFPLGNKISCS